MPVLEEVKAFLKSYSEGKTESTRKQADIALTHWENFTRQKPTEVEPKDVDKFIYVYMKRLKPNSRSVYLFHIGKYLAWSGRKDLEKYIMDVREKLDAEEIAKSPINHRDILKMLTKVTELRGKLIIRLLVFSEIPIGCLKNLRVRYIYNEKNYEMHCESKFIHGDLYSDTPRVIRNIIKERKLKPDDELIDIGERQIQNLIPDYAKKVGILKRVTPYDLRRFGKNPHLRDVLVELYEKEQASR